MLFPMLWTKIELFLGLEKSNKLLHHAKGHSVINSSILLGLALGPVFTTCSPTYLFILGTILPASFSLGVAYLLAYIVGLMLMLVGVGYASKSILTRMKFASNPNGWIKRCISILLIILGVGIMTGFDKLLEQKILETGYWGPIQIEESILQNFK